MECNPCVIGAVKSNNLQKLAVVDGKVVSKCGLPESHPAIKQFQKPPIPAAVKASMFDPLLGALIVFGVVAAKASKRLRAAPQK